MYGVYTGRVHDSSCQGQEEREREKGGGGERESERESVCVSQKQMRERERHRYFIGVFHALRVYRISCQIDGRKEMTGDTDKGVRRQVTQTDSFYPVDLFEGELEHLVPTRNQGWSSVTYADMMDLRVYTSPTTEMVH